MIESRPKTNEKDPNLDQPSIDDSVPKTERNDLDSKSITLG